MMVKIAHHTPADIMSDPYRVAFFQAEALMAEEEGQVQGEQQGPSPR